MAVAHANQAWLFLREEKKEAAKENARTAIRLWRSLPIVSPFQELAFWPLTVIAMQDNDLGAAIEYLQAMLHPSQHQFSADLTTAMENTIRLSEERKLEESRRELERTLERARQEKHL